MKQELINHFTWLANRMAQCNEYKDWSKESKVKELEEGFKTFYDSLKNNNLIDF